MNDTHQLDYIIDELVTLPSLPGTVQRLIQMLDDPDSTLPEIGKLIASDPSLSLKALRLVNSAFYGIQDKVNSVERATVLLGIKTVRNMIFAASVFDSLKSGEELLPRHSVACGTVMRILVNSGEVASPFKDPEEAFMYGLLHDIGKVVLLEHMPIEWRRIRERAEIEKMASHQAEKEILGTDHAAIGARLARHWKLQKELVAAIEGHHDPASAATSDDQGRAALIAVADAVCYEAGFQGTEGNVVKVTPESWTLTGMASGSLGPWVELLEEQRDNILELVSMAS